MSHPSPGITPSHSSPKSNFSTPSWGMMQMTGACDKRVPTAKLSAPCQAAKAKSYIWKLLANAREKNRGTVQATRILEKCVTVIPPCTWSRYLQEKYLNFKKKSLPQRLIMLLYYPLTATVCCLGAWQKYITAVQWVAAQSADLYRILAKELAPRSETRSIMLAQNNTLKNKHMQRQCWELVNIFL